MGAAARKPKTNNNALTVIQKGYEFGSPEYFAQPNQIEDLFRHYCEIPFFNPNHELTYEQAKLFDKDLKRFLGLSSETSVTPLPVNPTFYQFQRFNLEIFKDTLHKALHPTTVPIRFGCILVGDPWSGKTTFIKKVLQEDQAATLFPKQNFSFFYESRVHSYEIQFQELTDMHKIHPGRL